MIVSIPATSERVEMRLAGDEFGVLYLQHRPSGVATYSLRGVLDR
jgi:hypothetical protein